MTIHTYGLCAGISILVFLACCILFTKDRAIRKHLLSISGIGFAAALVCSRALWCAANYAEYIYSPATEMLDISKGGLSIFGAFMGYALSLFIWSRARRVKASQLFDAAAPALLAFTAVMRFAERYTDQALGIGKEIRWDAIAGTVLSVEGSWGEARFAVYRYEAALAAIMFVIAVILALKGRRHIFSVCFGGMCAFQTVFESLRDDYHMDVHYVRISQVLSMLTLLGIAIYFTVLALRTGGFSIKRILPLLLACAGISLVVYQEFVVDTALDLEFQYSIMLAGGIAAYIGDLLALRSAPDAQDASPALPGSACVAVSLVLSAAVIAVCALFITSGNFYWG